MNWQEFTALLVLATAMSFSPGPNTTLSTALAANFGLRHALRFCFAVPTGWTLLMLACGLGLGALVMGVPALRWGVKLLGVVYMLWLAWKLAGAARLSDVDASRLNVTFLHCGATLSLHLGRAPLESLPKWLTDAEASGRATLYFADFTDDSSLNAFCGALSMGFPPFHSAPKKALRDRRCTPLTGVRTCARPCRHRPLP
eukprot:gene15665-20750_t